MRTKKCGMILLMYRISICPHPRIWIFHFEIRLLNLHNFFLFSVFSQNFFSNHFEVFIFLMLYFRVLYSSVFSNNFFLFFKFSFVFSVYFPLFYIMFPKICIQFFSLLSFSIANINFDANVQRMWMRIFEKIRD